MPSFSAKPDTPRQRHVVMVLFPGTKLLDVTGPLQVFHDARADQHGADRPGYRVSLVSEHGGQVTTDTGVALQTLPFRAVDDTPIDVLLVSGGSSALTPCRLPGLLAWLARTVPRAARYGSVCVGAFILAACGHLDGRRAATHWGWCNQLATQYPLVDVDRDAIFVVDGKAWTSAGVSAGIDMALGMVEVDLGRAEALRLARSLVLYLKRPGGQSQFSASLERQVNSTADRFDRLETWIRANLASDLSVCRLAGQMAMSERSFARNYRIATGLSPARAVEMIRVDAACEMLCRDARPMKRIAADAGFGSEERMRRAFQRQKGVSPSAWKAHFGHLRDPS